MTPTRRRAASTRRAGSIDPELRTFGHVVVDEAQNLTPMELRMVVRRARRQSLTILGDIAQRTAEARAVELGRRAARRRRRARSPTASSSSATACPTTSCGSRRGVAEEGTRVPRGVRRAPWPPVAVETEEPRLGAAVAALAGAHERRRGQRRRRRPAGAHRRGPRGARRRGRVRRRHERRGRAGRQPARPPRRQGARVRRGRRRRAGGDPRRAPRRRPRRPLHRADAAPRARSRSCTPTRSPRSSPPTPASWRSAGRASRTAGRPCGARRTRSRPERCVSRAPASRDAW